MEPGSLQAAGMVEKDICNILPMNKFKDSSTREDHACNSSGLKIRSVISNTPDCKSVLLVFLGTHYVPNIHYVYIHNKTYFIYQIIRRFGISGFIVFSMYLDITCI